MKTGIGQFTVGEHTYKYEELAPMDALRFGTQCAKVLGPAITSLADALSTVGSVSTTGALVEKLSPALSSLDEQKMESLLLTAFGRVYTPKNERLGDEVVFNTWFSEFKDELFPVGVIALYHLSSAFFPKLPGTLRMPSQTPVAGS